MPYETENTEFKAQFTEDIYKEVIAFANTDGGVICVGIDNDGNAVGLAEPDKEYTRITNGIRDAIRPDVTMFVRFVIQENRVVRIAVGEGTNKPYYLQGKGLRPGGVYVRQGASSVPASAEQIRRMIKESDGDVFEEMRSNEQELTFEAAKSAFLKYGVAFDETNYRALGLRREKGELYTNLALILSDQCAHTVKAAVFGDEENTVFRDSREFGGSVFTQLEETFAYLTLCNNTAARFRGLERIEKKDYPEEALREALLNALVHRDYGFSGSVIININDKRAEFISLGGLLPGLSPADIRAGISQPRNKRLAEVFHRLRLIESYGTGIRRIYKLYEGCAAQPVIEVTPNTFKLILPNMNAAGASEDNAGDGLSPQMKKALDFIARKGQATETEIGGALGLKRTRTYTILKQMRELGLIRSEGKGENKIYSVI